MEEKRKGSGGREVIARREVMEYSKDERLRAGGKGTGTVTVINLVGTTSRLIPWE